MNNIFINNQTDLSDGEVFITIISCLAGLDNGYIFTKEDNVFILKKAQDTNN